MNRNRDRGLAPSFALQLPLFARHNSHHLKIGKMDRIWRNWNRCYIWMNQSRFMSYIWTPQEIQGNLELQIACPSHMAEANELSAVVFQVSSPMSYFNKATSFSFPSFPFMFIEIFWPWQKGLMKYLILLIKPLLPQLSAKWNFNQSYGEQCLNLTRLELFASLILLASLLLSSFGADRTEVVAANSLAIVT